MEKQDRVQKHEHVMHVQHDITVDDEQIKMHVQNEHIDEVHDEKQRVTVHHVQQDIMEMETQHRQQQHEHVVRVEIDIIVDDEMIDIHVQQENMEMEPQQHQQKHEHVVCVKIDIIVDEQMIGMRVQQDLQVMHERHFKHNVM